MKKILTTLFAVVTAASVYAQGTVALQETAFHISTNGTAVGQISSTANSFYFTVLVSSSSPTSFTVAGLTSGTWLWTGIYGTNGSVGPSVGGIVAAGGANGSAAQNWAAGTTLSYVVLGWSATEGSSWASVSNEVATASWTDTRGFFGASAVGSGAATASPAPAYQLFGANSGQLGAFTLSTVAVPEPTTMALAGLGGLSLLLFRRRK